MKKYITYKRYKNNKKSYKNNKKSYKNNKKSYKKKFRKTNKKKFRKTNKKKFKGKGPLGTRSIPPGTDVGTIVIDTKLLELKENYEASKKKWKEILNNKDNQEVTNFYESLNNFYNDNNKHFTEYDFELLEKMRDNFETSLKLAIGKSTFFKNFMKKIMSLLDLNKYSPEIISRMKEIYVAFLNYVYYDQKYAQRRLPNAVQLPPPTTTLTTPPCMSPPPPETSMLTWLEKCLKIAKVK